MVEVPKPSDIQNVFAMDEPQHMLAKLMWEIRQLTDSMSVWTDNEEFPVPIFVALNTAVTAWHITDWLWQSKPETRAVIAARFKFEYNEGTASGLNRGLERFQNAVAGVSPALRICREIANGSKHMRKKKSDPKIKAEARWHKVVEASGFAKVGDFVMSLQIEDGDARFDAVHWFIEAFGFWERLFREEKLIAAEAVLADKIIKAPASYRLAAQKS